MKTKGLSLFLIFIIIGNFILFIFGRIDTTLFWAVLILVAFLAYKVLPKINKKFK
jgi:hypothetical protein